MKTFRVINQRDVTTKDFNDLPFWVDVEGELVWVTTKHHVHDGELYDTLVMHRVINNKAQPVWQNYAMDRPDHLIEDLDSITKYPKPIFFMEPIQLYRQSKLAKEAEKMVYKYSRCECEVSQGEPCYCNLK